MIHIFSWVSNRVVITRLFTCAIVGIWKSIIFFTEDANQKFGIA